MVKIRLMRVGKTKQPSYRVVIADQRSPRDGRIIEAIGHYNPRHDPSIVSIDTDRAVYWLGVGAQPSDQVRKLLEISGAWAVFKGEAPPPSATDEAQTPTKARKATPASSVKVTPAASVEDEAAPDEAEAAE
jgi:small subunit ribosomal protein S16